jgi:hypothetical protein
MKRKITGAILIALSFSFLWQALGQRREPAGRGKPCHDLCFESFIDCENLAKARFDGRVQANALENCARGYHRCLGNCVR